MAFHITQCPCCNSTFSISAQLLHAANGKVRCGACLSVFLAEQQLVDSEPATDGSETNDSVFVGHAPEDYFDPASFLTHEALQQQSMNSRVATAESEVTGKAEAEHRSNSAPALPQSSVSQESAGEYGPAEGIAAEAGSERGRARAINTSATPAEQTNSKRLGRDEPDKLTPGRKNALEALRRGIRRSHRGTERARANQSRPDQQPFRIDRETVQPAIAQRNAALNALDSFRSVPGNSRDKARLPDSADDIERSPEAHRSNKDPLTDTASEQAGDRNTTDRSAPLASQSAVRPDPRLAAQTDSAENTGEAETAGLSAENKPVSQTWQAAAVPDASEVSEAEHAGPATHDRSPKEADHGLARNPEDPEPDSCQARGPLTPEKLPRGDAAVTPFPDPVPEQHADAANSSEAIRARALKMKLKDEQAPEQFAAENLASLQAVATPVQLHSDSPTRWGRTLTLLLSAVLLGMSLAGQHLWRNQEFYSQQARWRPLLEWVCADRGCDLPLYDDLPAIEPSNLSVRSHPNRADAIMVQVQIRNTAPFEQAFPVMIVGFNTADNELIALREFSPAEYLQGELTESATMPVMAPVPINLSLMDPGEDAVNYTLAFRRP
ncbi:MAG: zinc-ribbon and DUF3426 domain-containing protein [Pseudohongiellaceae bacterium]